MYLEMKVKETDVRAQLASIVAANPASSYMYIFDVKARLRDLKDDLVANPFKRPVPLDLAAFKKVMHSLFHDPSSLLASNRGAVCGEDH